MCKVFVNICKKVFIKWDSVFRLTEQQEQQGTANEQTNNVCGCVVVRVLLLLFVGCDVGGLGGVLVEVVALPWRTTAVDG